MAEVHGLPLDLLVGSDQTRRDPSHRPFVRPRIDLTWRSMSRAKSKQISGGAVIDVRSQSRAWTVTCVRLWRTPLCSPTGLRLENGLRRENLDR